MSEKIKDFVKENLILPDIQREFVWDAEKICKLFDSILRGYPIGNMLVWKLKGEDINKKNIRFYNFLQNYNEFNTDNNDRLLNAEPNTTYYAILDGQQRTQSLIIGLNGFLKLRKNRGKYNDPNAYKKNYLYINLIADENKEEDYKYEFKFLTEETATNDEEKKWFQVCRTLNYCETSDMQEEIVDEYNLIGQEAKKARKVLAELFDKINARELINWFEISAETDIDEVLNIFVRTNSGGVVLSKTDLLFSTIVSDWTEAREKVEELIDTINNKGGTGKRFKFTKDFVMRTILYILDKPIQMNVNTFKNNIKDIKNNWQKIEKAFKDVPEVLKYLGFSDDNLIAYNAVMPIIYYIYKGGETKGKTEKEEIRKYLVVSQLEKLYGVASNSTLINVREALRKEASNNKYELKNKKFRYKDLKDVKIVGDRDFSIDNNKVEKWFEYDKGDYTFMVLSLLYPCAEIETQKFHQDHMHPESKLKSKNRNKLANLQLLEGNENESKNDVDLEEWLEKDSERKKNTKYLPTDCSFSIDNFEEFMEKRTELMKEELLKILNI